MSSPHLQSSILMLLLMKRQRYIRHTQISVNCESQSRSRQVWKYKAVVKRGSQDMDFLSWTKLEVEHVQPEMTHRQNHSRYIFKQWMFRKILFFVWGSLSHFLLKNENQFFVISSSLVALMMWLHVLMHNIDTSLLTLIRVNSVKPQITGLLPDLLR